MEIDQKEIYQRWEGEDCPVGPLDTVTVIQRCGLRVTSFADGMRWSWGGTGHHTDRDVVAWTRDNERAIADPNSVKIHEWVD